MIDHEAQCSIIAFGHFVLAPGIAHADPCRAALARRAGETFSAIVRYVGDGDSLCVGSSDDPVTWIEVRLGDFDAPELHSQDGARSKHSLKRRLRGRNCRVVMYDRVIAVCRVDGQSVGELLREAGAPTGGN